MDQKTKSQNRNLKTEGRSYNQALGPGFGGAHRVYSPPNSVMLPFAGRDASCGAAIGYERFAARPDRSRIRGQRLFSEEKPNFLALFFRPSLVFWRLLLGGVVWWASGFRSLPPLFSLFAVSSTWRLSVSLLSPRSRFSSLLAAISSLLLSECGRAACCLVR